MKKRKLVTLIFFVVGCFGFAFGLSACEKGNPSESTHTHSYTQSVVAPTCTEEGYTKHSCFCGDAYSDTYVNALGHNYATWVSNGDGTKTATCDNGCGTTDVAVDEYYYTKGLVFMLNDAGDAYIVKNYKGTVKKVYIPTVYHSLPVIGIGERAFKYCSSLTEIVIPDSVTDIGEEAFDHCNSLTEIVIPDSVTSIGYRVFHNCDSLTEIVIPDSVTSIGAHAFYKCSSLTEIVIPDSVTSIGAHAFFSCDGLTEIVIPDSVTSIGDFAFFSCDSLTEIVIPDSVTNIGNSAFFSCSSLQYTIEDNCKYLGNSNNPYLYLADTTSTNITMVSIHQRCKFIGKEAFYHCGGLTEIIIPDSVTSIGSSAFEYCYSLTEIVIPDSVTTIGYWAFWSCENLTIYCEAESKPIGWDDNCWYKNLPVVWGYKGE